MTRICARRRTHRKAQKVSSRTGTLPWNWRKLDRFKPAAEIWSGPFGLNQVIIGECFSDSSDQLIERGRGAVHRRLSLDRRTARPLLPEQTYLMIF